MSEHQTNKRRFSMGSFFLGLLFGAAVGAVAGTLLAPASGPDTRAKLQNRLKQGQTQDTHTVDNVKDWSEENKTGLASKIQLVKQAFLAGKKAAFKKHEQLSIIEHIGDQGHTNG